MRIGFLLHSFSYFLFLISASTKIRPERLKLLGPANTNQGSLQGRKMIRIARKRISLKASIVFSTVGGHVLTLPLALYLMNLCISNPKENNWLISMIHILQMTGVAFETVGCCFLRDEAWNFLTLMCVRLAIATFSHGGGLAFFLMWNGPLALASALAACILVFSRIK